MINLTEQTARQLIRELRINNNLLRNSQTANWVKVSVIKQATGWDNERLRRARLNKEVVTKKDNNGIWYDLSSINPIHFINKVA
jgi:hypothetical protein